MSSGIPILNPDVSDQEQYAQYYNMETQHDPNIMANVESHQEKFEILMEVDTKESEIFSKDILKYLIKFLAGLISVVSLTFIDTFNKIFVSYDYQYHYQTSSFDQFCRQEYYWNTSNCDNVNFNDYWYQRIYQRYLHDVRSVNVQLGALFFVVLITFIIISFGVVILRNQQLTQRYQYYLRNTQSGLLIYIFTALISSTAGRTYSEYPNNEGKIFTLIGLALVAVLLTFSTFIKDRIPYIKDLQPMEFVKYFILFTLVLNTILAATLYRFPKFILLIELEIAYGVYYFYQLHNSITQKTNYKRTSICSQICSKVSAWRSNPTAQPDLDPQIVQQVQQKYLLIDRKQLIMIITVASFILLFLIYGNGVLFIILGYIIASIFIETQIVTNLEDNNPPVKNQNVQIAQMILWVDMLFPLKNIIRSIRK